MEDIVLKIIIISYAATSLIDIIAYWPTIKDLSHHKKPSANCSSYIIWTITTWITFLYSLFILPDFLFRIVSWVTFFANLSVLILLYRLNNYN